MAYDFQMPRNGTMSLILWSTTAHASTYVPLNTTDTMIHFAYFLILYFSTSHVNELSETKTESQQILKLIPNSIDGCVHVDFNISHYLTPHLLIYSPFNIPQRRCNVSVMSGRSPRTPPPLASYENSAPRLPLHHHNTSVSSTRNAS